MNAFGFRARRDGPGYLGEYRLAHWSRHRAVVDAKGRAVRFVHRLDATIAAAAALVAALNGDQRSWRGPDRDEARARAELFFARSDNGKDEEDKETGGAAASGAAAGDGGKPALVARP